VDQAHAEKVFQHEDAWKLAPPIEQSAQGWNARADRTIRHWQRKVRTFL
jgi:hypothetical protein